MSTHKTFRQQVSDHIPALRLYARSLRRHRDQADDLEQDCMERALSRSHLYAEGTNLRGWLFTIMRNLAITQIRREAFRQRSSSYYGTRWLDTVEASQDVFVELKETIELTKTLTAFERRVVEHMCLDDLSYDETARRIGNPIGTIKSRLSRARRRLRDAVKSPEIDGARSGALAGRPAIDHSSAGMQSAE